MGKRTFRLSIYNRQIPLDLLLDLVHLFPNFLKLVIKFPFCLPLGSSESDKAADKS